MATRNAPDAAWATGLDFVALDFETADHGADSACAVALVKVAGGEIVRREARLIRPPRKRIVFTDIHGIAWADVAGEPTFADLWPRLEGILDGARFIAAHNAPFDRSVLTACCAAAGLAMPAAPFVCTVQLARRAWRLRKNNLPTVCAHLGIDLDHHQAASDAEACARIVLAAAEAGVRA